MFYYYDTIPLYYYPTVICTYHTIILLHYSAYECECEYECAYAYEYSGTSTSGGASAPRRSGIPTGFAWTSFPLLSARACFYPDG